MQTSDSGDSFAHFCECQLHLSHVPREPKKKKWYRYDLYSAGELILNGNAPGD